MRAARLHAWNVVVALSAALCLAVALFVGGGWVATRHDSVTSYTYSGSITRVSVTASSGPVVIVSSSSGGVEVRRTDRYAFGHRARERRSFTDGIVSVSSRCPRIVVGNCSASYEVAVPETATVEVRTTDGSVRLEGFRGRAEVSTDSGDVEASAYCGFGLTASSRSGNLRVAAACAPQDLQLTTGTGNAVALVPPGRYRVNARGARTRVSGVTQDAGAPFSLDLSSGSGAVTIGGGL